MCFFCIVLNTLYLSFLYCCSNKGFDLVRKTYFKLSMFTPEGSESLTQFGGIQLISYVVCVISVFSLCEKKNQLQQ